MNNNIENDSLDYAKLIDDAMHHVVKSVLEEINTNGLPGDHHFFITFKTEASGVMMSDELKAKYPEEMTIVIQHQFYDLEITDDYFSVVLSFDHVKQNLTVPFSALLSFVDPSVKFGLQFNTSYVDEDDDLLNENAEDDYHLEGDKLSEDGSPKASNVVTLDAFRKDKK